ncbi:hypothetical protein POVCU2_0002450 [Plasmodium ovale curtisi]|uniref:Uncharacterized protein n=1 Tax=Plasmodium ovale curtisi TaxID=864141 RepID=A0A1A8VN10_PLAOA|nr:hypothetical protein POVCU2_0002450 [Plasmodium ovale curtisi]SBS80702.1 hypothetical protein POVCU1_002390 [Plasmodium ovale curtisi]
MKIVKHSYVTAAMSSGRANGYMCISLFEKKGTLFIIIHKKVTDTIPYGFQFDIKKNVLHFACPIFYKCDTVRNEVPFYKIRNSDTCQVAMLLTPSPWSVGKEKDASLNLCRLRSTFAEELGVHSFKNVINEKMG